MLHLITCNIPCETRDRALEDDDDPSPPLPLPLPFVSPSVVSQSPQPFRALPVPRRQQQQHWAGLTRGPDPGRSSGVSRRNKPGPSICPQVLWRSASKVQQGVLKHRLQRSAFSLLFFPGAFWPRDDGWLLQDWTV